MMVGRGLWRRIRKAYNVLLREQDYVIYPRDTYAHHRLSFSQEGEDLVLAEILGTRAPGFFVDVGAHHPQRFSNTYAFYLQGWRGINIDATPGVDRLFERVRPEDTTVCMGVGRQATEMTLFEFDEPALNTFSRELAESRDGVNGFGLVRETKVQLLPLVDILDAYLPPGHMIDLLNVDVEGLDLDVLQSNDWVRYRPKFVLAETLGLRSIGQTLDSPVHGFMEAQGYAAVGKTLRTMFFEDQKR